MAKYGRMHADEVKELAAGLKLPHIPPWEFVWQDGESPEAPSMDKVHYMMRPAQVRRGALTLALRAERQPFGFYASVAESFEASAHSRIRHTVRGRGGGTRSAAYRVDCQVSRPGRALGLRP